MIGRSMKLRKLDSLRYAFCKRSLLFLLLSNALA
jgi:hypothetical protein